MSAEESSTSKTGGRKITKPQQFSLIPPGPLWELAEHFAKGSEKYGAHNVRKGYEWSKMYDAAMRHLTAFWGGEDRDEETGSKHLAAVAFYAILLMEFMETHREYDDRYKPEEVTSNDLGSGSLIVHETINENPPEKPIAHFDIHRDGRIVRNSDIDSAHTESVREQVSDTTRESYDAWEAGRPFGRFATPTEIREDK